jgi:pSer/pThr/pTyr-binding forkhead associated (FHA) protein
MSSSSLPDHLQIQSQTQETGCLLVEGPSDPAVIYLLDGYVVYAETGEHQGISAFFVAMSWEDPRVTWQPRVRAPKVLFKHPVNELLFQYAQLEDSGQTDEAYLSENFSASSYPAAQDVKLMDLSQYEISFEVLNGPFQGFQFIMDRPELLVGRLDDCQVILPDGSVSGHHCRIVQEDHCVRVVDLGSTNGTLINGELISDSLVQVDDEFIIGTIALAMKLKMRRKLEQISTEEALPTAPAVITEQKPALPNFSPQKFDSKALTKKTSRVTGAITWKNLTAEAPKKTTTNSLFSKMFGKK